MSERVTFSVSHFPFDDSPAEIDFRAKLFSFHDKVSINDR